MYNVSRTLVYMCSLIFFISHPFSTFLANYILDTYGLKVGISIGVIGMMAGMSVRLLINESFYYLFLGQTIFAISNTFILNSPTKIAAAWFRPQMVQLIQ